jgi:thiamine-phosphate pyrophosphorylase
LALLFDADGAHLGERSLGTDEARTILGPSAILGRSVHDIAGARAVVTEGRAVDGADYLVVGPVFATPSHPGRPGIGTDGLARIVAEVEGTPVIAIGGIGRGEVSAALGAGAHGVAVVRGAWESEDVGAAIHGLMEELSEAGEGG